MNDTTFTPDRLDDLRRRVLENETAAQHGAAIPHPNIEQEVRAALDYLYSGGRASACATAGGKAEEVITNSSVLDAF